MLIVFRSRKFVVVMTIVTLVTMLLIPVYVFFSIIWGLVTDSSELHVFDNAISVIFASFDLSVVAAFLLYGVRLAVAVVNAPP